MLCEGCKKNEATVHLTEIINEVKIELHLCESCTKGIRLNSEKIDFSLSLQEMLSFLEVDDSSIIVDKHICKICGLTYADFREDARIGCTGCYKYLRSVLEPIILSYFREEKYKGKKPLNYVEIIYNDYASEYTFQNSSPEDLSNIETINELKEKLEYAVIEERYEDAAILRDKVREIDKIE